MFGDVKNLVDFEVIKFSNLSGLRKILEKKCSFLLYVGEDLGNISRESFKRLVDLDIGKCSFLGLRIFLRR